MNFNDIKTTRLVEERKRAEQRRLNIVAWIFAVTTFSVIIFGGVSAVYVAIAVLKHFGAL